MKRHTSAILLLITATAISGCDQLGKLGQNSGSGSATDEVVLLEDDVVIVLEDVTPVAPASVMTALIEDRGVTEALNLVSSRNGHEIWRAGSGDTLTLREGVIIGTTALTPDVVSVETTLPSEWLTAPRPAIASRVHRLADGDEQMFIRAYQCEYSASLPDQITLNGSVRQVSRTDEACNNPTQSFTNSYWLDGSGRMVQSRQWLGPKIGYLRLNYPLP
ncbi:YjbF family lipoprotein [Aliiruegeria sabulilitoris]|uniref:YjbF family lipoprotein n=1 Tax=Aliiruegeria sabulilitoris TaxID=1510458 RepID=UPI000831F0AB|nr:YjbF family lipoprotein [Aliiruegeria sabulilitoris]NDR58384.1 YjbF family lipoprotein [Pseudoruegeria sp. M32A2M]